MFPVWRVCVFGDVVGSKRFSRYVPPLNGFIDDGVNIFAQSIPFVHGDDDNETEFTRHTKMTATLIIIIIISKSLS